MSDRRVVKVQKLVAAAAALDRRTVAKGSDLWPIIFAIATPADQDRARDLLRDTLEASANASLTAAAENASLGPLARAQRLERAADDLLRLNLDTEDTVALRRWRRRLEGVAREIDATFPSDARPDSLQSVRDTIVGKIAEVPDEPPAA